MDLFIVCSVTPVCLLQELQSYRKKRSTATSAAVTCGEIAPGLTKWSEMAPEDDPVRRQGIGTETDQVERQGQVPLRRLFT